MAPFVFELKKSEKIFLVSPIKIKRSWPETKHLHPSPSLPEGGEIGGFLLFLAYFSNKNVFNLKHKA